MNPYEELARQKKATAIVDFIWKTAKPKDKTDYETLRTMRLCSQEARDIVAGWAGQKSPSEETWELVVKGVSERIQAARWGKEQTA